MGFTGASYNATFVHHLKNKKMYRLLFLLCVLNSFKAQAQIDPKNIKNIPVVSPKILKEMDISPAKIFGDYDDFYLIGNFSNENRVFAKDPASNKIAGADDINEKTNIRWTAKINTDGTVTICNKFDNSKKLIENTDIAAIISQGTSIRNTGSAGGTLATIRNSQILYIDTSTNNRITNKWFLKKISGTEHWLIYPNRRDSFKINVLLYKDVPFNTISWNFESLTGWETAEGSSTNHAFTGQPSGVNHIPFYNTPVIPPMPLGGSYWQGLEDQFFALTATKENRYINTARPGTNRWALPDDTKTGVLVSKPFLLCSKRMNYNIGGTNDINNIKFELYKKLPSAEPGAVSFSDGYYAPVPAAIRTGHNNDVTRGVMLSLDNFKYSICRIKITDNSSAGHILVSNIDFKDTYRSESIPPNPAAAFPQKPIWGAIDMHTHPVSYMGMGGKLMHGQLDGDPAIALGNCNCTHGGWGTDNTCGNYLRAEIVNLVDEHDTANQFRPNPIKSLQNFIDHPLDGITINPNDLKVPHNDHYHDGYPALIRWPAQSSMIHQQMWFEWLQRANQGGLKAIIALTINSEVLAKALGADGQTDDKSTADRQIAEITAFAARHPSFLGIARNPAEMRSIINSGRMAIIIGMEVDHIGNFYANATVTETMIRDEIASLKRRGVSYIFPIHAVDNKFGGAAAYKFLFNYANKFATGQPLSGSFTAHTLPPVLPGNFMKVEHAPDSRIGFGYSSILNDTLRVISRTLVEMVELGGLPPIPPIPPLPDPVLTAASQTVWSAANAAIVTANTAIIPVMTTLKASTQYQLLKKYFLDVSPEMDEYRSIEPGHRNSLGLTDIGKFTIKELMRQGMMIDMDHSSEKSVNDIIRIAVQNDYPVNAGHNSLRANRNDNEKTRTKQQLDSIRITGGMFGIGWENQTPADFNTIYSNHLLAMGNKNTTFGSDIDGYAATPKKPVSAAKFINYTDGVPTGDLLTRCRMGGASLRSWDYNTEGMAHIGLVPDFFEALKKDGMSLEKLNQLFLSAEYFAQMWEKCERRAPLVER